MNGRLRILAWSPPERHFEVVDTKIPDHTPRKMKFFEATDDDIDAFIKQVHTYLETEGA